MSEVEGVPDELRDHVERYRWPKATVAALVARGVDPDRILSAITSGTPVSHFLAQVNAELPAEAPKIDLTWMDVPTERLQKIKP
ncbi:MAG TPA: hypothetical protein VNL92_02385, partial [Dehalococcoidia bacterium]|nr:hypothetical protein [Dehalococcoidia bacterium]